MATSPPPRFVLASASPRRQELLARAGFSFTVASADINETALPGEGATALALRLARAKALTLLHRNPASPASTAPGADPHTLSDHLPSPATHPAFDADPHSPSDHPSSLTTPPPPGPHPAELPVLGADTVVEAPTGELLGKPADPADAARMLRTLAGSTHRVVTGVCVAHGERIELATSLTFVHMLTLSEAEIAAYIATSEPLGKAGAYAIQGRAARSIPWIHGDYSNVVGLPLALATEMLATFGIFPA